MWTLANIVLALHIALFIVLFIGLVAAATGWLKQFRLVSLAFWVTFAVTLGWQPIPGCPLTDLEKWLRWQVEPDWDRDVTILHMVVETVTGAEPPWILNILFPAALVSLAVYAFVRHHLRDTAAAVRGAYSRLARDA